MFNSGCYTNGGYSLADIAAATGGNRNGDGMWGGEGGAWWIIILFLFCFAGWGGNGWNGGWGNSGGFPAGAATGSGITDGYILTSDFANIERKIDSVNNGLCDGFYAMNTGMLNGFAGINNSITQQTIAQMQDTNGIQSSITNLGIAAMQNQNALQAQIQNCCCANEKLVMQSNYDAQTRANSTDNMINNHFATLNYNLADQSCQTRRTIADATRDLLDNQNANTRAILDFMTQDKIATLTAENQSLKFAASQAAQNTYLINELRPCPVPAYQVPNPYAYTATCGCGC